MQDVVPDNFRVLAEGRNGSESAQNDPFQFCAGFKFTTIMLNFNIEFFRFRMAIKTSLLGVTGRSNYRNEHKNKFFHIIKSKISFHKNSNLVLRAQFTARIYLFQNTSKLILTQKLQSQYI